MEQVTDISKLPTNGELFEFDEIERIELTIIKKGGKKEKIQSIVLDDQKVRLITSDEIVHKSANLFHPKHISKPISITLEIDDVDLEQRYGVFNPDFSKTWFYHPQSFALGIFILLIVSNLSIYEELKFSLYLQNWNYFHTHIST